MGNCKDCKHWYKALGHTNFSTCERPDPAEYDEKIEDEGFAYYLDALDNSGLSFGIKTGPLFGCIKFIPKP